MTAHTDSLSLTRNQIERFWSNVDKTPGHGPKGDCWLWIAGKGKTGYGRLMLNKKNYYAYRISVFLSKGINPQQGEGCHSCDNPPCCNPDHINIADHLFNMRECLFRGRMKYAFITGDYHHNSKLTEDIVGSIREERRNGAKQKYLSEKHGVHVSTIKDILHYRTWRSMSTNEVRLSTPKR